MLLRVQKDKERFETYMTEHYLVNSVFRINNGYDYLVEAVFRNMRELTEFVQALEKYHVKEHKEFFVLEDLKREAFLTTDTHVKMLLDAPMHRV